MLLLLKKYRSISSSRFWEKPTNQESTFKFFAPEEDTTEVQTKAEPNNQNNQAFIPPIPTDTSVNNINPFDLNAPTKSLDDATSTSMDNLLAGVENQNTKQSINLEEQSNDKPDIPPVDMFNNPFARNPIFGDNIKEDSPITNQTPNIP